MHMNVPRSKARKALIIFMRYPEPGRVKTRLSAGIGAQEASRTYEKLARTTLGVASDFAERQEDVSLFLFYDPPEKSTEMKERFPGPWHFIPQRGEHLGVRMGNAIEQTMARGFSQVVLVGSDIAHPSSRDYSRAFSILERGLVPLGPAQDGGFYLIGLNRYCHAPFAPRTWGQGTVFRRTRQLLQSCGFLTEDLPTRTDVDREDDLESLRDDFLHKTQLSVVIPTVGDPAEIKRRITGMQKQLWPGDEIVIASAEGTFPCTKEEDLEPVRCVKGPMGRGRQLNRGAGASRNNLLLFLHDDSLPPPQFPYLVRRTLQDEEVSLGCFSLEFTPSSPSLALIARWANVRSAFLKMPYGDQGLFCRRETFERVSGFRKPFIFEDVDFVRSCRSHGRLEVLNHPMLSSSRRYLKKGVLKASLHNHFMVFLYFLGVENRRLHQFYYGNGDSAHRLSL